jgi:DNA/RNA-binding domain of Phe-tRNA-synthetase-like protein
MSALAYTIDAEVFRKYPGYVRGVLVAQDVVNPASPPELVQLLRDAEASVRERLNLAAIAEAPRIRAWRDAYRAFGAKPAEHRSSIEALSRRALKGDPLPSISALVDIGNVISLRHLVPAGAHAIDHLKHGIALRPATGQEDFVAFGSEKLEHPLPGEIVFVEGDTVLTRRWTWRQAKHTLVEPGTTAIVFNVDCLLPVMADEAAQACAEAEQLIARFCGGRFRRGNLGASSPRIELAA